MKLLSSPWLTPAYSATTAHNNHFFRFYQCDGFDHNRCLFVSTHNNCKCILNNGQSLSLTKWDTGYTYKRFDKVQLTADRLKKQNKKKQQIFNLVINWNKKYFVIFNTSKMKLLSLNCESIVPSISIADANFQERDSLHLLRLTVSTDNY